MDDVMLIDKSVDDIRNRKYLYIMYKVMKKIGRKIGPVIVRMDNQHQLNIDINEWNYVIHLSYLLGKMEGGAKKKVLLDTDYINGEIYKQVRSTNNSNARKAQEKFDQFKKEKDTKMSNKASKDYINVRPDFVIHQSHDVDYDYRGQKLIIEAKTTKDLDEIDFCWDFLKLNFYVDEFKFKNALYMLVNIDRKQIIKMFNIYREKIGYYCNDMSKIWLFVQNWDGEKMSPVNIYQIEREPAKNKR